MAKVVHTIKGHFYLYEHHREGDKVVCDYLYPCVESGERRINGGTRVCNIKSGIEEIKNLKHEEGMIYDSKTKKLLKKYHGGQYGVKLNPDDLDKTTDNIFIHNHPVDELSGVSSSLSPADYKIAANFKFKEVSAVTPTGFKYTLKVTSLEGRRFCFDASGDMEKKFEDSRKRLRKEYAEKHGKFLSLRSKDNEELTHATNEIVTKDVEGVSYTRTRIV